MEEPTNSKPDFEEPTKKEKHNLKTSPTVLGENDKKVRLFYLWNKAYARNKWFVIIIPLLIVGAISVVYFAFAATSVVASVQAEQMTLPGGAYIINDKAASNGKAVRLPRLGSGLKGTVNLPAKATSISVVAHGSRCRYNSWPSVTVYIDGMKVLGSVSVNNYNWKSYSATTSLATSTHSITIQNTGNNSCAYLYVDDIIFYSQTTTTPVPTVSFSANPQAISSGSKTNLNWNSTNATSCSASGGWSGSKALSGTESTAVLTSNSTYSLTCSGSGGSSTSSTTVTINSSQPPVQPPTQPPTQPPSTTPMPLGVTGSWNLKFADEFSGTQLDLTKWRPNWLDGTDTAVTKPVNSAEISCYDPSMVKEGSGVLTISAVQRACQANNGVTYNYASGIIESYNHYQFTYGYMEARMWLDGSTTPINWPAFWADGTGTWPVTGEIDTLEVLGGSPPLCWHFHYSGGAPGGCVNLSPANTGWHVFGADWEPGIITFYYDGKQVGQVTSGVTSSPMYLIANLGISTQHGGPLQVPARTDIDYIRAWQH